MTCFDGQTRDRITRNVLKTRGNSEKNNKKKMSPLPCLSFDMIGATRMYRKQQFVSRHRISKEIGAGSVKVDYGAGTGNGIASTHGDTPTAFTARILK